MNRCTPENLFRSALIYLLVVGMPISLYVIPASNKCDAECKKSNESIHLALAMIAAWPLPLIVFLSGRFIAIHWFDLTCGRPIDEFQDIEDKKNQYITEEWKHLRKSLHDDQACTSCLALLFYILNPYFLPIYCLMNDRAKSEKEKGEKEIHEAIKKSQVGSWEEYKDKNFKEGGAMLVQNWRDSRTITKIDSHSQGAKTFHVQLSRTPIEDLKRIAEHFEFSAITIYDDYDHAVLRKFDYKLTGYELENHCEWSRNDGYKCTTFVWDKNGIPPKTPIQIAEEEAAKKKERERQQKAKKIELMNQFIKATDTDEETAKYYLEIAENDFKEAIKKYYSSGGKPAPDKTKIDQFLKATDADEDTARFYLEAVGNDFKEALKNYFSSGGNEMPRPVMNRFTSANSSVAPAQPIHMQQTSSPFMPVSPTPSALSICITINNEDNNKQF